MCIVREPSIRSFITSSLSLDIPAGSGGTVGYSSILQRASRTVPTIHVFCSLVLLGTLEYKYMALVC